jgi:parallel beta-helix repeat protein
VCLAEAEIWYVDDDTCPAAGDGSLATPFCALQDAVDAATPGKSAVWVFEGTYAPIDVVDVTSLWIVGETGAEILASFTSDPAVRLSGTTDLTLEGIAIRSEGGTGLGIECNGNSTVQPTLTARGCTIENNAAGGVTASSCTVTLDGNTITGNSGSGVSASSSTATLDGNTITGNSGGGINLSESEFTVVNNVIALNGGPSAAIGGVSIYQPGSVAEFAFNTVVENDASSEAGGIYCVQAATIESSLVYDNTDGDLSASCTASYSWTTSDGDPGLAGSGDYHLAPGSPCIDAGNPAATLDHDIDGQSRPQGTAPDIGADEAG